MEKSQLAMTLLVIFLLHHVNSTLFYVSKTGLDTNNGTIGFPFQSVEMGFSVLNSGDSLMITSGTYNMKNTTSLKEMSDIQIYGLPYESIHEEI
jgi:hypothetical protein